jgi:hypothetical protein
VRAVGDWDTALGEDMIDCSEDLKKAGGGVRSKWCR